MANTLGYAARSAVSELGPFQFERRTPGARDVQIDILFCGVCHSDLHMARNEWKSTVYPVVPGHEIVGRVTQVGAEVRKFKAGDLAGVGCMVGSCQECASCRGGLEQYCEKGFVLTYNSPDKQTGLMTYGGYSKRIVVDEGFVLRVPTNLDLAGSAPLLCAGITTYSPLKQWNVGKGQKVGIVGLGGLGHMGVKFSHALGAQTVVFTTSPKKVEDARRLGADQVVISTDADQMKKEAGSFDFILNTVSARLELNDYISLLRRDGTLCMVGLPEEKYPTPDFRPLLLKRRRVAGSIIGGIRETQEMFDFCSEKNIVCDIETIPIQKINEAYGRMLKSDVKYRFVIDMASLK
ncbi:MAG: NAD(P)-dependent alcohol dehydrogenase [Tepidisphaeraceae bacterium]|jgi:uncharacterized zinc-type alcohol dehydrogenase-like protein